MLAAHFLLHLIGFGLQNNWVEEELTQHFTCAARLHAVLALLTKMHAVIRRGSDMNSYIDMFAVYKATSLMYAYSYLKESTFAFMVHHKS